MIQATMNFP
ncbi:Protein of unknown function [Bacillus toyonensis]|nr:Protein of unknown function [Bacillus mobilis]SCN00428.1 Protein of unknown function [Bacillus cereus]SCN18702.1 Protein of unknown function [Bacillus toyonensis]SCN37520.1 Protein of unknown function [Bacillus cereus]SCV22620.1 Protein of unknown function [Bacillus cereus]